MPIRRAPAPLLAAGVALATILATSACSLVADAEDADGATTSPTPTASHSTPTAAPDDAPPQTHTSTVTVGDVVLEVAAPRAPAVQADQEGPGTGTVTLSLAPGESARLALTSSGVLDVDSDGSITVLDGSGTPVAAVGPPAPTSGTEADVPRIEVSDVDATSAQVEVDDRTSPTAQESGPGPTEPPEPQDVAFVVGTQAIESATWGENEGGRSLAVDPADWARYAGQAGLDLIRTQLVAAEPEADSSTMGDQLVCHAVGAPDKATWNLEPWRPDVGLILAATAHCNPV